MILGYNEGVISFVCSVCGREDYEDISEREIQYNEELDEYYPIIVDCSHCEAEGSHVSTVVNINIPEIDEMELEVMELLAPKEECTARREIRKLMWEKRPDLAENCPIETAEKYRNENAKPLNKTIAKIAQAKRQGGKPK